MDSYYLTQPLPLITLRIQFELQPVGPLPVITIRTDFAPFGLKTPGGDIDDKESETEDDTSDAEMEDLATYTHHNTNNTNASIASSDDDDDEVVTTQRIRKPAGEPGRPKSGGYTLEKEIASWGPETIAKVNVSAFCFHY